MNNSSHNGKNYRRQPPAHPGHPSLPPRYQHQLQQHRPQDPQLAFLLANAAATRGQPPTGGGLSGHLGPGSLGAGNSNNGGGFIGPGPYGNGGERHGGSGGMPQSAAALFEEQIFQRASALRAEALMQQQSHQYSQQHHQQQLQIQAALQAFQQQRRQQQQQLSSLNSPGPPTDKTSPRLKPTDPRQQYIQQQQEAALLARTAALRDPGLGGSASGAPPPSARLESGGGASGLDHIREQIANSEMIRHRQQQSQQRASYGLEQEIELVRQAQRVAALGSPKSITSAGPPKAAGGESALLGILSAVAASSEAHASIRSDAAAAAQKAMISSGDGSERVVPSAVTSISTGPKPKAEAAQKENGASKASKRSPNLALSPPPSGGSSPLAKMGRTTPPLKPNPRKLELIPEKPKATKCTAGAGAAAAAAVRCKTKDELRKNPGTVIVPCRARGMPMDHNFISAYFVISEDAKHGENLVCSYYACRNGGIKFRYCAYCMAPVAKRNFSRRHDHGMSKKKDTNSFQEENEEEEDDDTIGESENTASDKGSLSSAAIPSQYAVKRPKDTSFFENESKRPRLEANTISVEEKNSYVLEDVSSKRRFMWNDLLNKRPRAEDPKDISSWLNEVLAVSDLEFPLDQVGTDMDQPFGKVLLNELPKLTNSAATPSEDEAPDSGGAVDTSDSNSSPETIHSSTKDVTNSSSESIDNINNASNSKIVNIVVGNENPLTVSLKNEKEAETTAEMMESKTTEGEKADVEDAAISTAYPQTPIIANEATGTIGSSATCSKGLKLLGKKANLSLKKSITAGAEETKDKKEDEGFAGSFADWRDRKKGKSLKKGSSLLRK